MAALVMTQGPLVPSSRVGRLTSEKTDVDNSVKGKFEREPSLSLGTSTRDEPESAATGGLVEALLERVESARPSYSTKLDDALAVLKRLVLEDASSEGDWMHAARLLKSAAVEQKYAAPRIASVALLLADALTFTDVDTVAQADRAPLSTGLQVLMQSFVSTDDERAVIRELLAHRWYITAAFDQATFGVVAE